MTRTKLFFIDESAPSEWLTSGRWASTNKVNKRYVYYSLIDDGVSLVVEVGENYIRQSAGTVQAILDLLWAALDYFWANEIKGEWRITRKWDKLLKNVKGVYGIKR